MPQKYGKYQWYYMVNEDGSWGPSKSIFVIGDTPEDLDAKCKNLFPGKRWIRKVSTNGFMMPENRPVALF